MLHHAASREEAEELVVVARFIEELAGIAVSQRLEKPDIFELDRHLLDSLTQIVNN